MTDDIQNTTDSTHEPNQGVSGDMQHKASYSVCAQAAAFVRAYPLRFLLLACILVIIGFVWATEEMHNADMSPPEGSIPLVLAEDVLYASVVRLDKPNASTSGMVLRQGMVLMLVLGTEGIPAIRFANHSVDILWLDADFRVLGWEHERASQVSQPLDRPDGARYALLAPPDTISAQVFATGYEVKVTEKSALF